MSKNLVARIAVAVVAMPVILWICYLGGWWLFGMVLLFAVIGAIEFLYAEGHRPHTVAFWLSLAAVASLIGSTAEWLLPVDVPRELWEIISAEHVVWIMIATILILGMLFAVGKDEPARLFQKYTRLIWGILYIGGLYPFVMLLGTTTWLPYADAFTGGDCLLFLFAVLWVGDTAAMWVGSTLGKHKLAPAVSPNKTIEGFIGGLLGAALVGVVMALWRFSGVPWQHVLGIAVGSSLFGQLGDLVESMWKRSLQIKDSSAIIPGHGGVLDRFDSLLFAAPFMYFYLKNVVTNLP